MDGVLVMKFGGNSISVADLGPWVRAVEASARPLVIVPGGGPFAEVVKKYQPVLGYDDGAAHHMAILAMEQFGRALASLGTRLETVATLEAIEGALERGKIPVWMPAKLVLRAGEIRHGWSVTSDSLAAWLSGRLAGSTLCLIKQLDMPPGSTLRAISAAGVVDEGFGDLLHPATAVYVAGPSDLAGAARRLAAGTVPGREIDRSESGFAMAAQ